MTSDTITFPATVYKVQTLQDGSVRVTLDLGEGHIPQMAVLATCQQEGRQLQVTVKRFNGRQNGRAKE